MHRRPGAPDGQRLRLPDPGHGQRRDARPLPAGERTIVTACPHCFNTIGNEYGQLGGRYEVVHHCAYLARARGRRAPGAPIDGRGCGDTPITFHDSCYLARYNGVDRGRRAPCWARSPACELREMERAAGGRFCCGAGGGRMWMEETRGTRINAERTRQALETGADDVATACPFCIVMMRDGLADAGPAGAVDVQDVAEVLAASALGRSLRGRTGPAGRRGLAELVVVGEGACRS